MKKLLFFFLLVMPLIVQAQQPVVERVSADSFKNRKQETRLYDDWKFHAGDDAQWASPLWDDASWIATATVIDGDTLKELIRAGFNGVGWFRKAIYIDSGMVGKTMAFTISGDGATAIYFNGKLLYQFGRFKTSGKSVYKDPQGCPVVFAVNNAGRHLIAVKYENYDAVGENQADEDDEIGFRIKLSAAQEAIAGYNARTLYSSIIVFGSGCLFGTLAFIHFMLFFFYKRASSNFYFGLFNLSIAVLFFSLYTGLVGTDVAQVYYILYMVVWAAVLAAYALSAFVNNLFPKRKWSHYVVVVCAAIIVILSLLSDKYISFFAYILAMFASLEAIILIILAMVKKIPGSRILGTGILCFFLFLFIAGLGFSLVNSQFQWKSDLGLSLALLVIAAIFSIPISISFYLAWSFSGINKNLSRQLDQVEALSKKTLKQELEKQQLLEGRKEELEKEVALRTTEVMYQKEQIEQQHDALKAEKQKSDDLLLNILPAEVAQELKEKGEAEAKLFDHVSVLFTDFVNFTQMSERMNPQQLVAQLHENFKAFDEIMERNGLEKIKTIGDAYLAVSGMPITNEMHAYNAVKAGQEIVAYISNQHADNHFEVRVGIHSGPLVAGIVGVKKFAYDIWGDTVNTASRMESSGAAGKVNISESTYELVKNDFTFMHRGKIDAKHKGAIDMYFVVS